MPLSAWARPAMMRSSVDLPEPDLPSRATISPSASAKSTPSSTVRGLPSGLRKDFDTPRRSISLLFSIFDILV
jgi:hypothetical protein